MNEPLDKSEYEKEEKLMNLKVPTEILEKAREPSEVISGSSEFTSTQILSSRKIARETLSKVQELYRSL